MGRVKEFNTDEVLKKAMAVFGEYGYEGASLSVLLDQLGIARQSLYDTFGTKQDLFILALKRYMNDKTDAVIRYLDQTSSVRAAVRMIFEESVRVLYDPVRSKECFILNSAVEQAPHLHEIGTFMTEHTAKLEQAFYEALVRGHNEGEIRNPWEDLHAVARFLNHARLSLTYTAKTGADQSVLEDIVRVTLLVLK